ncbi:MAG: alpha/beta fold hydrolase, partial [Alphaproteobacteria bacterium]
MSIRTVGGTDLWVEEGGRKDGPTLLLMHGLSGTGEIWGGVRDILADRWPGRWIIPDMRGHGRSDHSAAYGIGSHAADMAALLQGADNP